MAQRLPSSGASPSRANGLASAKSEITDTGYPIPLTRKILPMKTRIHAVAGAVGLLMIFLFWTATVISELFGSYETIATVKGLILCGMIILIPAMAIAGGSGMSLSAGRSSKLVATKKKRMPFIAANGLLVLLPMAFFLEARAAAGTFDTVFYTLQGVELLAGATNFTLLALNARDGAKLTGRTHRPISAKLLGRELVANNTLAIRLAKPTGFSFEAGQAVRLTIPNKVSKEAGGQSRILSIASAPHEADLTFVTRVRESGFKQALQSMPDGAELEITGPFGSFIQEGRASRPTVFLAGGIGITPFLSMIRSAEHTNHLSQTTLFYSNRSPADSAMLIELEALSTANPGFQLVATMTDCQDGDGWTGETGYVDAGMLRRHLPDLKDPIYYCVGPGAFVAAMQRLLASLGINSANIRTEHFGGY